MNIFLYKYNQQNALKMNVYLCDFDKWEPQRHSQYDKFNIGTIFVTIINTCHLGKRYTLILSRE